LTFRWAHRFFRDFFSPSTSLFSRSSAIAAYAYNGIPWPEGTCPHRRSGSSSNRRRALASSSSPITPAVTSTPTTTTSSSSTAQSGWLLGSIGRASALSVELDSGQIVQLTDASDGMGGWPLTRNTTHLLQPGRADLPPRPGGTDARGGRWRDFLERRPEADGPPFHRTRWRRR